MAKTLYTPEKEPAPAAVAEVKTKTPPPAKMLSERFVPGQTRCKLCKGRLFVRHTEKTPLDNGDILITRSVKCGGPKRHSYQINETIRMRREKI